MVTIEEQRQLARVFGRHQTGAWGDLSALPYVTKSRVFGIAQPGGIGA